MDIKENKSFSKEEMLNSSAKEISSIGLSRKELLTKNRVHIDDPLAISNLKKIINRKLQNRYNPERQQLIIICIGTDRSTGDSLGPLIGSKLANFRFNENIKVLGSLESPIHATNLEKKLEDIEKTYPNPFILAIDASLGKSNSVGSISVNDGPLKPGSGVNKNLPPVGHLHISGLVNVSGYMEYFVLQSTRLSLVIKMSKIISCSLFHQLRSYNK
ncbi:spore protease YyaC [Orenia marismortui]|uniref:spore protease YyaC n=1 Tax=Orenia marismortui TaxID=46469 RepID=UPI0003605CD0|nr:spore protease YyaC [Orenia marismortui]